MNMATKRKHTILSMQQRLDVLKDLQDTSLAPSKLAKKYGVNAKTIQRIKRNATKINAFADKSKREKERKKVINPVYKELDKCMISWYMEKRTLGGNLSDSLILEKARELKNKLPLCSQFKVSRGWLCRFKRRHNIHLLHKYGKKTSANQDETCTFVQEFRKLIEEENIDLENTYNLHESGLLWKALPTKTLAEEKEKDINGHKIRKDRITIGLCANALGTHKIMPVVIYRYKTPRALKHEVSLPVILKSQANAWMTRELFLDWFENYFKPTVRQYQEEKQISGKVILLVDNCEAHNISSEVSEGEDFQIMYIPPTTTFSIQSMDQGVIEKTKRLFRHKLLQRVLTYDGGITEFYKDYTLKNCIDILATSWSEITPSNIRNEWNNIIELVIPSNDTPAETELEPDWQDMISVVTGEECTQQHVIDFLSTCDKTEKTNEEEHNQEEAACEEEPQEEQEEIIYKGYTDEAARSELQRIFERLTFYSARAPTFVQCMIKGIQMFFLGKEY